MLQLMHTDGESYTGGLRMGGKIQTGVGVRGLIVTSVLVGSGL
jgi:hypothetical protein